MLTPNRSLRSLPFAASDWPLLNTDIRPGSERRLFLESTCPKKPADEGPPGTHISSPAAYLFWTVGASASGMARHRCRLHSVCDRHRRPLYIRKLAVEA